MARLIGEKPRYPGEIEFYEFAMKEIPDYVYVMFNVEFHFDHGVREADAILLVPHIGVFVMEIKGCSFMYMQEGQLFMGNRNCVVEPRPYRPQQLQQLRNITCQHIHKKFHITPFVYEIHCFPNVSGAPEVKEELARTLGSELVFFSDDLTDSDEFMLKLNICRMHMNKIAENRYRFCDLTDIMAHYMYMYWETGMDDPKRPAQPPFVFLSHKSENKPIADEIKAELENRGIFVWKAPDDVMLSEYYLPEEMAAIEECDSFVILLSLSSMDSNEVRIEFDKAVELNKHIIPLRIQDVELNEFYKKTLAEIQYRDMFKINSVVMNEVERCIRENIKNDKKH